MKVELTGETKRYKSKYFIFVLQRGYDKEDDKVHVNIHAKQGGNGGFIASSFQEAEESIRGFIEIEEKKDRWKNSSWEERTRPSI